MRKIFVLLTVILACSFSGNINAQRVLPGSDALLFDEGKSLFYNGDYETALKYLMSWSKSPSAQFQNKLQGEEVNYMIVVSNAENDLAKAKLQLLNFLDDYPHSVYSNKIVSLLASSCYLLSQYDEAIRWFEMCDPDRLSKQDCVRFTLHYAISLIKTGNTSEGYVQLSILDMLSDEHQDEVLFYKSYVDYVDGRLDVAQKGFEQTLNVSKFADESKLYLADIALRNGQLQKAEDLSNELIDLFSEDVYTKDVFRILGESHYLQKEYKDASEALFIYENSFPDSAIDRKDLFYLGMSCFYSDEFDKSIDYLMRVVDKNDELSQVAYLNIGLASLKTNDKNRARMAFEQASSMPGNKDVSEQALYNYALVIHETAYSPFAESVTVFERFLNEFPSSKYSDNVNSYLVDVYMNTNSYDAALASIGKIRNPGASILEAKQKLLFRKSMELFAGGQYKQVPSLLSDVISLMQYDKKTGTEAYFWRAESYYRLDEYTKSVSDYSRFLLLNTDNNDANYGLSQYGLGYIYYNQKDYNKALSSFKGLINNASGSKVTRNVIADAYLRAGDCCFYDRSFSSAADYYKSSMTYSKEMGDYALYQLGLVDGLTHDYRGKVDHLERLVKDYPGSMYAASALYEQGRAYQQMDESSKAIIVFQRLVSDYNSSELARKASTEIALIYYQTEKYDDAIKAYKSVISSYPGSDESILALRDLKSIYVEIGKITDYADYISEVKGAAPIEVNEMDSLTYSSAERLFTKGDKNGAKSAFLQYLKQYPNGSFAVNSYYYLGEIFQQENDYDKALDNYLLASSYEHSRFCEESIERAADLAYSTGDYETALDTYIRLNDKTVKANTKQKSLLGIVSSAAKIDEYDAVIQYADQALNTNPTADKQIEISYYKAKALLAQSQSAQAETVLKSLAKDVRSAYGAESNYLLSKLYFDGGEMAKSETNIMNFIKEGTTHTYWLARSFILLSDIYASQGKDVEARQYLLSLKQNYKENDDIAEMISDRLKD